MLYELSTTIFDFERISTTSNLPLAILLNHPESQSATQNRFQSVPPHVLVLLAIVAIQLGAGVSTRLFPIVGADGAVALQLLSGHTGNYCWHSVYAWQQ